MYKIKVTYSEELMLNGKVEDKHSGITNEYYSKEYPQDLEDVVVGTLNNIGAERVLSFEGKVAVMYIRQEDIEITEVPKKRV